MITKKELKEVQKYGMTNNEYNLEKTKVNTFSKLYSDKEPWQVTMINAGLGGAVGLASLGIIHLLTKGRGGHSGGGGGSYSGKTSSSIFNNPVNMRKVAKETKAVKKKSATSLGNINEIKNNLQNPNHVWEF